MTTTTQSRPFAAQLAQSVCRLSLADVPPEVLSVAKTHALDALGIAVASSSMDFGEAIHHGGAQLGAGEECRVLAFGTRMPAASAALVDGTLIHGLDFDDTHIGAIYHATGPALAAALAVGEAEGADGDAFLLAYVIGLEVGCRLAGAGAGAFHARGFHPTGIAGTFAAACVAAKLRGLDASTLTSALGLCGSQAAGILELHDSWLKRMHPGWAAHSGITAATLAQAGFRGPATVFEGSAGLYATHIEQTPTAATLGLEDLGERWMTTEIALKPYPCCHFTHAFADAAYGVLATLDRDRLAPEEVERVVCPAAPALLPIVCEPPEQKIAPATIYDALFSVQFVVANVLTGRPIDLATFYDEPLDDPQVLAMAARITCSADPDTDFPRHFPGEVYVHLTDGRILEQRVPDSHGTPQSPMSDAEVLAKFHANAERRLAPDRAARLAEIMGYVEELDAVAELIDACIVDEELDDAPLRASSTGQHHSGRLS